MRKAYSKQRQLDSVPIDQVELNLECRDSIIPVLRALQQVYSDWTLTEKVLDLIGQDVNGNSRTDCGREGMDYWHLLVLASVRLGCNLTYDQLHDLSENHIKLRATMGIGLWDAKTEFKWRRTRGVFVLDRFRTFRRRSARSASKAINHMVANSRQRVSVDA